MKKILPRFLRVIIACMLVLVSPNILAQDNKSIDLKLTGVSFKEFLQEIETKTNYKFVYDGVDVNLAPTVTANYKQTPVLNILKNELQKVNFQYEVNGHQVILMPNNQAWTTPRVITGKVTDEFNEPLAGAAVTIKNSTVGTITDINGSFSLTVPKAGSTLVIQFIGFKGKEIIVDSTSPQIIVLNTDPKILEEVVVTALGIKRSEKALGYATQTVDGKALQKVKGVELATSLTGKVAGLLVKNSTDFATKPELTVRGEKPIIVIDGIPYENKSLSDMASEDIESVSVLKGATASALYGSRGRGGAILITTKNGTNSQKGLTIDVSTNTMFSAGHLAIPEKQSIFGRGSKNIYDENSEYSWGPKMEGQILKQWDPYLKDYRDYEYWAIGKSNFKNFLQQGYVTNNNLNLAYKTDASAIRSSINWTQNNGQYPNQRLDKFTYTLGGDVTVDKLKLSSNVAYTRRHSPNMGSNGYTSYDPMYALLIYSSSDFDIRDYKNNYWRVKNEKQNFTYQRDNNNPYFDAYEKTNEVTRDIFNADLTVSYDLTNWVKLTARSGLDFFTDRGVQRISWGSYVSTGNTPIPGLPWTWNGATTGGYNTGQTRGFSMNNDLLLTGEKSFGKFGIEYMAGGTLYYKKDNTMYAMTRGGISAPGYFSLKASNEPIEADEVIVGQQVNSIYARAAFSWERLAFAELTGRNDWSSTMASTPNKSYFYPSVAGSFVVSELMPNTKSWIDMWKLRGSWTMSKKQADIYWVNSAFTVNNPVWGTMSGASSPSNFYNTDTRPETEETFEIGTQAVFLRNRLSFDLTYYEVKKYDELVRQDLSEASGYTNTHINSGDEKKRKGWEIILNLTPILTDDWKWDLSFNWTNLATYWSKIDYTYTDKENPFKKVGQRIDPYLSKDFEYDSNGNMIVGSNGLPRFSGYNSNFGWTEPRNIWGINTTLRYKNLTLFASFDGVVGGMTVSRTESYMWQAGVHPKSATDARLSDYVVPGVMVTSGDVEYDRYGNILSDTRKYAPNTSTTRYQEYISTIHGSSAWGGAGTRPDIYSRTFFKFRELSLIYDIPQSFLSKYKIKGATVGFVGQNLMLWAKDFKYSDPDGGGEDFADPSVRYLGGNIKITF